MTIDIRPGDVLVVYGRDLLDRAIEAVTHGPSHMALFIDRLTLAEAQGGRHIGDCPVSFYTSSDARLEIWRDLTLTDGERTRMIAYAKSLYGVPYDYWLIPLEFARFEFGAKLAWYHENKHRICSTFTDDCASHVGKRWSDVANPAPIDVMNGGALTKMYEREAGEWVTSLRTASA